MSKDRLVYTHRRKYLYYDWVTVCGLRIVSQPHLYNELVTDSEKVDCPDCLEIMESNNENSMHQ
jgi:hypothetical protein